MKNALLYLTVILLSSCLAEQTNPLVSGSTASCFDNIKNQNETDVDCGGVCDACKIPEEIAPCKASLTPYVIELDKISTPIPKRNYICSKTDVSYKIYVFNGISCEIEIYETELPVVGKKYPLTAWFDAKPGQASIKLINFYAYNSSKGELYLSYEDNMWNVEICSATLTGQGHTYEMSGSLVCDW